MGTIFRSKLDFHLFVIPLDPIVYGSSQIHRVVSDKDIQHLFQFILTDTLHLKVQFTGIPGLLNGKHQPLFSLQRLRG